MPNILEGINFNSCIWLQQEDNKNSYAAAVAGILFFTGWWIAIDAASQNPYTYIGAYHICGIVGSISMFMINVVSQAQISGDYFRGQVGPTGARAWLFIGFVLGFASVIASFWILSADFISAKKDTSPGVCLVLQNVMIFAASLIYKFVRVEDVNTW